MARLREDRARRRLSRRVVRFVGGLVEGELVGVTLAEIELSDPLPVTVGGMGDFEMVRVLVRLHGVPLGVLEVSSATFRVRDALVAEIEAHFDREIEAHLVGDGMESAALPFRSPNLEAGQVPWPCRTRANDAFGSEMLVSVVVATVGRVELADCLRSVLSSSHANLDVIVVDNRPADPFTRNLVAELSNQDSRVRYVSEPVPGTSPARNRGIQAARGEIVAFTDDDIVVDHLWVASLLRGFDRATAVAAVTGLTLPRSMDTPAEVAFEQYGGFAKGYEQRVYDLDRWRGEAVLYPFTGGFGSGGNMAVKRSVLLACGGFDERFGPATPTYCDEDLDLLVWIIRHHHPVAYEPAAIVRHAHRRDWESLQWQVFTYSAGMTAMLTKWALNDPRAALLFLRKTSSVLPTALISGRRMSTKNANSINNNDVATRRLLRLQRLGFAWGPAAYLRSAHRHRRRTVQTVE